MKKMNTWDEKKVVKIMKNIRNAEKESNYII